MTEESFFEKLRDEQDRLREQADYLGQAKARAAVRKSPRTPSRRGRLAFAGAAALSAAAAFGLWQWHDHRPAQLSFSVGDSGQRGSVGSFLAAPADRELPLRFADGTRVALGAGTSARVASLDAHGAHIVLEKGRAQATVVHRPGSHWRVDVGPFEVAVVGTRFDVGWDAATRVLDLRLEEGVVLVSGGFLLDAVSVHAGETLRAFADDARIELVKRQEPSKPAAPAAEVASSIAAGEPAPPVAVQPVQPSAPTWQTLASLGKYREAVAAAEKTGFDAECRRASGQELLALGDAARLSGATERARQAYTVARTKLPSGGRASYGLGLIAFDQRGDFADAAHWFEAYLSEQPSGALRAEATGRLMEALERAGQSQRARQVAEQYLARYPSGAQASLARKLIH